MFFFPGHAVALFVFATPCTQKLHLNFALKYGASNFVSTHAALDDTWQDPDTVSAYKVGLQWTIPIEAEITGGSEITGFNLRYAVLSQCKTGCSDTTDLCNAERASIQWKTDGIGFGTGILGPVSSYTFMAKKGSTYVFSLAARTAIGRVSVSFGLCPKADEVACLCK
jgi:hypothetical protein